MGRKSMAGRIVPAILLLMTSLFLTACEAFDSPQNTFSPAGKVAEDQKADFLLVTWIALPIMIGVLLACVLIPLFFMRKKGDPGLPKQIHGHTALELTWTIIPAILLAFIAVPTVTGIQDLGRDPSDEALIVDVQGSRFLWSFYYPEVDAAGAALESLPNADDPAGIPVLRIPVGREIGLRITSIDVNHSFWIPKLAGKTDAINNHPNKMWIRADEAGVFDGQCAEFCGLSHSDMRFRVEAMPEDEFNAWVAEQGGVETVGSARGDAEGGPQEGGSAGDDAEAAPAGE